MGAGSSLRGRSGSRGLRGGRLEPGRGPVGRGCRRGPEREPPCERGAPGHLPAGSDGDAAEDCLAAGVASQIVSQTPATFRWRRPRLEMTPFHLTGAGTDVVLSGHLEPEAGTYQFTAEGEVSLATLAPLWPGITAGGTGAFRFSRVGSETESRMEGWASVSGGRLQGGGLPLPVSSLEGRLVLDPPSGFHLEGVSLVAGGGKMTLEGKGTLDGARVKGMDIALRGSDVLVLAPTGFRGRYDLDLRLTQDASGRLLGGKIDLIRGVYDEDFRLERSLLSLGREEPASVEEEETSEGPGFLQTVNLDLDLEASRGLWIINDFATLEGAADFHVGGTAISPRITGRFSALEGGIIRFRQVRYQVRAGQHRSRRPGEVQSLPRPSRRDQRVGLPGQSEDRRQPGQLHLRADLEPASDPERDRGAAGVGPLSEHGPGDRPGGPGHGRRLPHRRAGLGAGRGAPGSHGPGPVQHRSRLPHQPGRPRLPGHGGEADHREPLRRLLHAARIHFRGDLPAGVPDFPGLQVLIHPGGGRLRRRRPPLHPAAQHGAGPEHRRPPDRGR